jgi:hypothetical protein
MTPRFFTARSRRSFLLLILLVVLFAFLRLRHLTTYGIWFDHPGVNLSIGEAVTLFAVECQR